MITVITLLVATLHAATPLALGALGGIFSERAGVINIALEGMMLVGAWAGVYTSFLTGSWLLGLAGAVVAGGLLALIHAVASINFKANQVVSGVAINLIAAGFTEFMMSRVWANAGQSPEVTKVPNLFAINLSTNVAVSVNAVVLVAVALVAVSHWALWHTSWGLRLRAVGEHPLAADTVGVSVYKMRYYGVLLSGVLAGLAGATMSMGLTSRFLNGMVSGRGFIALAAMIFGKWNPLGAVAACLLFGLADAASINLQIAGVNLPQQFLSMAPYVITMLALAGVVGRSSPPAADGIPYDKAS
jgi:ABC-type uncharacterized transport system permease subunit